MSGRPRRMDATGGTAILAEHEIVHQAKDYSNLGKM